MITIFGCDSLYPCEASTRLLIQCGADVNAFDQQRNTPLHIIAQWKPVETDGAFRTLQTIVRLLIDNGAHLDVVNSNDQTPQMCAETKTAETLLKSQTKISLKCITARYVKKLKIDYQPHVSKTLFDFIEIH
ncbi:unnamed protein product [Didymodactylos carnosus]|nr:unnamed protein product [Didymodactylos carnosus]CAF3990315.1 unnamed protein product [Didymodactylos carnosus]